MTTEGNMEYLVKVSGLDKKTAVLLSNLDTIFCSREKRNIFEDSYYITPLEMVMVWNILSIYCDKQEIKKVEDIETVFNVTVEKI